MIYDFTPCATDKNLGKVYNQYMEIVPNNDDWVIIRDRDTMYLQPNYMELIEQAIKKNPDADLFTCYTNRVGNKEQCYGGLINNTSDVLRVYLDTRYNNVMLRKSYKPLNKCISGFFMLFQKKTWQKHKFKDGILGVDNHFSQSILDKGGKIILIEGLYVYHYYRLHSGIHDKSHLK